MKLLSKEATDLAFKIVTRKDIIGLDSVTEDLLILYFAQALDAAAARAEAAEACTTCDSQPHVSGKVCICGGTGRRSDETLNLRQYAQATEERVRVLEVALQGLGTFIPDVGECFKPDDCRVWRWKHVPACEGARTALAEAAGGQKGHNDETMSGKRPNLG